MSPCGYTAWSVSDPKDMRSYGMAHVFVIFQIFVNGVEVKTLDWNTQKWTVALPQGQLSEVSG